MDRRDFTKTCLMCLSTAMLGPLLNSCQSTHYISGILEGNGITFSKNEFVYEKDGAQAFRKYVLVRNEKMQFPIYVYRFSETDYSALLMKCTHQGNELQASGDYLHCSAHGSEFNNRGGVAQGPAEKNLRTFKVTPEGDNLLIDLRV